MFLIAVRLRLSQSQTNAADASAVAAVFGFQKPTEPKCCGPDCGRGPLFKSLEVINFILWGNHSGPLS